METENKIKILAGLVLVLLLANGFQFMLNLEETRQKDARIDELVHEKERLELELNQSAARSEELGRKLNKTRAQFEEREVAVRLLAEALEELNSSVQGKSITVRTLAVEKEKSAGVILPVSILLKQGGGRLFVDVKDVLLGTDYQDSLKNAAAAATHETGVEMSEIDVFIHVSNPYNLVLEVTGESAGAAVSMGLIALLSNMRIKNEVLITGAVDERGRIYPITDVYAKANAAKAANASIMLVPKGQRTYVEGISIVDVSNVSEAMRYMLE